MSNPVAKNNQLPLIFIWSIVPSASRLLEITLLAVRLPYTITFVIVAVSDDKASAAVVEELAYR